jgi:hypothetical protein
MLGTYPALVFGGPGPGGGSGFGGGHSSPGGPGGGGGGGFGRHGADDVVAPEPGTWLLMATGVGGVVLRSRFKAKKAR